MRPSVVQGPRKAESRSLPHHPVIDILARGILGDAITLLDFAFRLFPAAGDLVEIIVRGDNPIAP
jgi:hypothetical protein